MGTHTPGSKKQDWAELLQKAETLATHTADTPTETKWRQNITRTYKTTGTRNPHTEGLPGLIAVLKFFTNKVPEENANRHVITEYHKIREDLNLLEKYHNENNH